jgi:hypothetical protein
MEIHPSEKCEFSFSAGNIDKIGFATAVPTLK